MEDDEFDYGEYNEDGYAQQEEEEEEHNHPQMDEALDKLGQEEPFVILPLASIYTELNQTLEEIQGLVYLDKGWCLLLLREFDWNKDYLKEEFYNKNEEYLQKAGFVPGLAVPGEVDRGSCGTCEVCLSEESALYYNICEHRFCLDCWASHVKAAIQSSSPFPKCMEGGCDRPVLLESIVALLGLYGQEGAVWLTKYEKKLCEQLITGNRLYQFCTGADCGNCIRVRAVGAVEAVACTCGKVFCFACQSDDHYPCLCEEKAKWVQQVMKEEADAKWISQNAKICPWCKKAVERSMGCNFMACRCGKSFCYMCSQPWEPDHRDHFKCHIFKRRPDDELSRERQVIERMNHCTERYIYNQAVANSYRAIDIFSKRKYLFKALRIDLSDSEFMDCAYRFAIECCEKLKWIYAFTYFYDLKHRKDAFEFSLGEYERYKENLVKLLAVDLRKLVTTIEEWDAGGALQDSLAAERLTEDFMALKKQIVDYYTWTKNFKDKFVEEVKHITALLNDEKDKAEMRPFYEETRTEAKEGRTEAKEERPPKLKRKGKSTTEA